MRIALTGLGLLLATPALADSLPSIGQISDARQLSDVLRDHGYPLVWDLQRHGGVWTGRAIRDGRKVDIMVDVETGDITSWSAHRNQRS